jgi:glycosyltransferase involved in cell wall biosynthesis
MKILYVGHTYTVRVNQAKIAALAHLPDVEITLVTPHAWRGPLYANRADAFDTSKAPNVTHHIIRAMFTGKESAYVFSPAIVGLIRRLKPDIVHVEQGAYALSYYQILWALKLFSPRSRALFFTWWNLPYVPHGIKKMTESFNLAHSSAAIAGNAAAKEILRAHGFIRPVYVLPQLGIDLPKHVSHPDSPRSDTRFTIGYAGRIADEKGVLDLVGAVSSMKNKNNVLLYFVGAGDALEHVKQATSEHSIALLHHPAVRNEELSAHLAKMDVLVLPSRSTLQWVEQFGHILLEAMAMGVPVIGSSSGEIPNVIGDAGLIFNEGEQSQLAAHLDRLYSNENERQRLASMGRTRVQDHFTHETIAKAQIEIYKWMIREGQPVSAPNGLSCNNN